MRYQHLVASNRIEFLIFRTIPFSGKFNIEFVFIMDMDKSRKDGSILFISKHKQNLNTATLHNDAAQ